LIEINDENIIRLMSVNIFVVFLKDFRQKCRWAPTIPYQESGRWCIKFQWMNRLR